MYHSFIYVSFIHSFSHSFIHSLIRSLKTNGLFIYLLNYLFIYIRSIHSFIQLLKTNGSLGEDDSGRGDEIFYEEVREAAKKIKVLF